MRCTSSARRRNSRETQDWFNTPGMRRCRSTGLRGHVVLVDFWTYTCINCIRTLPYLKAWDASLPPRRPDDRRRGDAGVRLRARRRQRGQRDQAVRPALPGRPGQRHGHVERLRQRVLAGRLPDRLHGAGPLRDVRRGRLRQDRNGDPRAARRKRRPGRRAQPTERRRRAQLSRPRPRPISAPSAPKAGSTDRKTGRTTTARPPSGSLALNEFAFSGTWKIAGQPATAVENAGIDVEFQAKNVYLVLSSAGGTPRPVQVLLDGRPIPAKYAGADVHDGVVTVRGQRLYTLVSLAQRPAPPPRLALRAGRHRLRVHVRLGRRAGDASTRTPTPVWSPSQSVQPPRHHARRARTFQACSAVLHTD